MNGQTPEAVVPDEKVARQIVERLIEEGLVARQIADELLERLMNVSFKEEDWRLLAEKTLEIENV